MIEPIKPADLSTAKQLVFAAAALLQILLLVLTLTLPRLNKHARSTRKVTA